MPHIRIRAVKRDSVLRLSQSLIPELAKMLSSNEDNFTLENISTEFFTQGKDAESYPFVEVLWFLRPQEIQDRVAKLITDQVRALTKAADIIVVFQILDKTSYYENGTHY